MTKSRKKKTKWIKDQQNPWGLDRGKCKTSLWGHLNKPEHSGFPDKTIPTEQKFIIKNYKCEEAVYDNSTILKQLGKEEKLSIS